MGSIDRKPPSQEHRFLLRVSTVKNNLMAAVAKYTSISLRTH